MSHSALVRVQAVLARLLPPAHAEALLGDLLEERRLRLRVGSPASVACWYWRQLASSLPVLLWSSFRRRSWFLTLVVAIGGYIAAAAVTSVLRVALSPMTTSALAKTVIVLLCSATGMAVAGYVAALIRPGAAPMLAVLVLVSGFLMLAMDSAMVPLWFEGSFLVLVPLAPIAGAALSRRWREPRRLERSPP